MADVQISPVGQQCQATTQVTKPVVWVSNLIGYVFYQRNDDFLRGSGWYVKTTDGGQTWGSPVQVNTEAPAINRFLGFSCWFDQWTPGNTGTKIHITWNDRTAVKQKYRSLDTSTDTFGAQTNVNAGVITADTTYRSSIAKARGGNIYVVAARNGEKYFYCSTDNGATWEVRTAPTATNPACQPSLTPGNEADTQDIYGVWYAGSNLNLYWYDDSANTWTTTLIYTDTGSPIICSSSIRKSDNHTLVVAKKTNGANYDLPFWDVDSGTTFTAMTNVYTNQPYSNAGFAILVATSDKLYVSYNGYSGVPGEASYKSSEDGGTTWSTEIRLDSAGGVTTFLDASLNQVTLGGRIYGMWMVSTTQVWGNYGTSLPLLAGGMTGLQPPFMELMLA